MDTGRELGEGRHRAGRPRLLTPEVEERLVEAVEVGAPVQLAVEHAGISAATFYRWMQSGRDEVERRAAGEEPDPELDQQVALLERIVQSRAKAAVDDVATIKRAARGGYVLEETIRRFRDPETGQMVEESTVRRAPADWRAAAWRLERQHSGHFGRGAEQVEITGAGGGPVQLAGVVDADALARRLAEHFALESGAVEG